MCHTLSVSVEGLEMRENGDHGVFLGMESQHLTNMVSVKTDECRDELYTNLAGSYIDG